ncbi:hypothetical protein P3T37_004767 [Kitasatospora sp. MAA4]|nr:hypothetical protein [Kitasatospora sp. MAA4]MDH6135352.1 hypothetical protein [Kitasatospora sp. MAA4]
MTSTPRHPRIRRGYLVVDGETPELAHERIAQARQDLVADIRPSRG